MAAVHCLKKQCQKTGSLLKSGRSGLRRYQIPQIAGQVTIKSSGPGVFLGNTSVICQAMGGFTCLKVRYAARGGEDEEVCKQRSRGNWHKN